jgi:DHA1 family bicyclomycin/chloramphenicol resistance-like MFS transporter
VLAGLALMVLTSIGCALVESPTLLLGLRFVQGVGASVSLLAATVAADYFRGARLVSVVGWLGAAWAASPVLAPVVGGFLVQVGSWRLVFGLLAVMAAAVALRRIPTASSRHVPFGGEASVGPVGERPHSPRD